jgi:hypothetical protein
MVPRGRSTDMVAVPWLRVPRATDFFVLGLQCGDHPSLILQLATQVGHLSNERADLRLRVSPDADGQWIALLSRVHHRHVLHPLIQSVDSAPLVECATPLGLGENSSIPWRMSSGNSRGVGSLAAVEPPPNRGTPELYGGLDAAAIARSRARGSGTPVSTTWCRVASLDVGSSKPARGCR